MSFPDRLGHFAQSILWILLTPYTPIIFKVNLEKKKTKKLTLISASFYKQVPKDQQLKNSVHN